MFVFVHKFNVYQLCLNQGRSTTDEENNPVLEPDVDDPHVQPDHCSGDQADNATISEGRDGN